ncbi:hypothetical protein TI39_contig4143g00006 [Zymoseptoria brevis]|uniref:D-3-phosphoglycerate dehydrogenase like protein n=1 Tax=Zymoseptoria brevis TaxID=1047168 RepID=A0A0F4GC73_9PEZI|nr:hypothetical protein TI39_contig4143g00006 [Zymoseptoria brevis]
MSRPKVFFLNAYHPEAIKLLNESDVDVVLPGGDGSWYQEADGILIRSETRITDNDLALARKLEIIVKLGSGVDNIDLEAARNHGVAVCNTAAFNSEAVAELTMTLAFRGLIGKRELGLMRRHAILVNCARGGIVDEEALLDALEAKQIFGAALDDPVTDPPTVKAYNQLLAVENCIITTHVGGSTEENQAASGKSAVETILAVLNAKHVDNRVVAKRLEPIPRKPMPSTTSQSALQNQQPNDVNVSSALRYLQRSLSVVILNLDLSAVLDQSPRDI